MGMMDRTLELGLEHAGACWSLVHQPGQAKGELELRLVRMLAKSLVQQPGQSQMGTTPLARLARALAWGALAPEGARRLKLTTTKSTAGHPFFGC